MTADHLVGAALAVTLEPCLMCRGAAMALGVAEVYFGSDTGLRRWAQSLTDLPG